MAAPGEEPLSGCAIGGEADLLRVRQLLRERSKQLGMGLVDQTKVITAGSELARNILKYGGGVGRMEVETLSDDARRGIRVVFADHGPGIANIPKAMEDGYSTSGSLGLGLPGARRLVDDFAIDSTVGKGTTVTIVKWTR
jgi:serine/threonine-protein kinase RsbT